MRTPLSSEFGTYDYQGQILASGKRTWNVSSCSLFARKRGGPTRESDLLFFLFESRKVIRTNAVRGVQGVGGGVKGSVFSI